MARLDEYMEFPSIFTFKIIGESIPAFTLGIEEIFASYPDKTIVPTMSSKATYISMSVTVMIQTYEELEALYEHISKLKGLRFYV
jgi:putative lipoic acid-binding regulatory protein